jgi:hypothetical protein
MSVPQLADITRREVKKYAGVSDEAKAFAILDDEWRTYAVTAIRNQSGPDYAWIIVQAHIEEDYVVVDEDNMLDKNLIFALLHFGVPREQIVLAYRGERLPMSEET